jgi:23S rRNA (adenine2503-C2)-methyltransferase
MRFKNAFYLPSGRVFLLETEDGHPVECTEMRDVSVGGKEHLEVRKTLDPHVVWRHLVPYEDKWLLTVSTQKGCVHKCKFCDVPNLPFKGNLTSGEILSQIDFILKSSPYVKYSNKAKIGFARMGEPAHNFTNVRNAVVMMKPIWPEFNWLPCFNSILPKKVMGGLNGRDVLREVVCLKERDFNGFLHFQISCNSTDEKIRKELFGGADVLSIEEIISEINKEKITNRTITLNFIVMKGVPVDVNKLVKLGLNSDKFCVKLIPLNITDRAENNKLETYANYSNYDDLLELGCKFNDAGVPTVIDAIAKCEEAGLCCGQLAHIHCKGDSNFSEVAA